MKVLVTGGNGQLGRALQQVFDEGIFIDVEDLDITNLEAVKSFDYAGIDAIINAAAFTNVDGAELPENAGIVNKVNVEGVKNLAVAANQNDIPLVHVSTDYVFDGEKDGEYNEDDERNPKSVYGKTKADSEDAAAEANKHYILRTSWVIGDGHNFVRTMLGLAEKGVDPSVVNDQVGRPTFTPVLAMAIKKLLGDNADYGLYHVTNSGVPVSWADLTREIFNLAGVSNKVTGISTAEYFEGKENIAFRPKNSMLSLAKAQSAGIDLPDWKQSLKEYIEGEK